MRAMELYDRHAGKLRLARDACRQRGYFTLFAETPDRHPAGGEGLNAGKASFEALLGKAFQLDQPGQQDRAGEEVSPYLLEPLGIDYPLCNADVLFEAAESAMRPWMAAHPAVRLGLCMEVVDRLYQDVFVSTQAVMHTAGQSLPMSYAGSGANALDRGVEALSYAEAAMLDVPDRATWERRFGSSTIRLDKRYRLVPRGVAVCFSCASFPTWNAYPAMLASLATGNAVILKPHPGSVLPMALAVRHFREVLAENGFSPDLVTLCLDTQAEPIGKRLVCHPKAAIVDFTGSAAFGAWVEAHAPPRLCYTETSGTNNVVIESCESMDAVVKSLATTMSLFSAQMCTSPQNIYLPRGGVACGEGRVSAAEFAEALGNAMSALANDPRRAGGILAAIQAPATLDLVERISRESAQRARVVREAAPYLHPDYPRARTCSPLLVSLTPAEQDLYAEERFGPIGFVIECEDAAEALGRASGDARRSGAITAFAYSVNEDFLDRAEEAFAGAGAQLTCNLTGPMPLNFAAAYSDYHVTGLNPAGNATLTDLAFVASRFRITQSRRPASRAEEAT
ncbi:MAG: aldehyde dehydrogenase family protein [Steroidobacteraceae bacterium]